MECDLGNNGATGPQSGQEVQESPKDAGTGPAGGNSDASLPPTFDPKMVNWMEAQVASGSSEGQDKVQENWFASPDGWEERFESVVEVNSGAHSDKVSDWLEDVKNAHVIVVSGHERQGTEEAALELGFRLPGRTKDLRRARHLAFNGSSFGSAFSRLRSQWGEGSCNVIDYWNPLGGDELYRSIEELSEAAQGNARCEFALILWTNHAVVERIEAKRGWPSVLKLYTVPRGASASSAPAGDHGPEFFRGLFGHGIQSLRDVLLTGQRLIERALVRIIVLFGDLPESDVEELLEGVLKDEVVQLDPLAGEEAGSKENALRLWRGGGKAFFIQNAGLSRLSDSQPPRIGFANGNVRAAAAAAAWEDAHAMVEVFSAIREAAILFSDDAIRHRQDLFEGYVSAAGMLASKVPRLYGSRWLGSVSAEYLSWVSRRAPEVQIGENTDYLSLLAGIENVAKRNVLRQRFVSRMGYLCRFLAEAGSERMVEDFLANLEARQSYLLLFRLVLELISSRIDTARWMKRVFSRFSLDGRQEALRMLAHEAAYSPEWLERLAEIFHAWISDDDSTNTPELVALAFPFVLIDLLHGKAIAGKASNYPLGRVLRGGAGTSGNQAVFQYILRCFSHRRLDVALRDWEPGGIGELSSVAPALALLQAAALEEEAGSTEVLALARAVREAAPKPWKNWRGAWQALGEHFSASAAALPFNAQAEKERGRLQRLRGICRNLNHL